MVEVVFAHRGTVDKFVGDMVYGSRHAEKGLEGQCLHARTLRFIHPRTNEPMELTSELPEYFLSVLSKLGPEIG